MKHISLKKIIVTFAVGLILSLLSLLYVNETTYKGPAECIGNVCPDIMIMYTTEKRGFPMAALVMNSSSADVEPLSASNGSPQVSLVGAAVNWLLYSTLTFLVLLFWRPKAKTTPNTPHR